MKNALISAAIFLSATLSTAMMTTAQTNPPNPPKSPPASSQSGGPRSKYPRHKSAPKDPADVHDDAIVIDTHADTPQRFLDEHFDLDGPLEGGQINLKAIHDGNLGAEFFFYMGRA